MNASPRPTSVRTHLVAMLALFTGLAPLPLMAKKAGKKTPENTVETKAASVWKVSSETCTVYLAGSVHLLREEDYPLPPVYDEAYADAEDLYFEIDLADSMDLKAQMNLMAIGKLPDGETIKDRVGEETYSLLQDYLMSRGLGGPLFESMKPGMLAMTIASMEYMRIGAMPYLGVDMVYFNRARKDTKPVAGFETAEYQMKLFDGLSVEKQEQLLRDTLEGVEDSLATGNALIAAWKCGDDKALTGLLTEQITNDKEIAKALLYDRNRKWVPKIVKILKGDRNAMVVVGTGHLVGRRSVVDFLRKRGYDCEQMRYESEAEAEAEAEAEKAPEKTKKEPEPERADKAA